MKPVDLDELERLRERFGFGDLCADHETTPHDLWLINVSNAFPAMRDELRTRRKQVEEARHALAPAKHITSARHLAEVAMNALASLESGEPRHE